MIVLCGNLTIPYCGRFFHCFYLEERKNCATALAGHCAAILFNRNLRLQYSTFIKELGIKIYGTPKKVHENELISTMKETDKLLFIDGLDHVENYMPLELDKFIAFIEKLNEIRTVVLSRPLRKKVNWKTTSLSDWSYEEQRIYLELEYNILDGDVQSKIYEMAGGYPIITYYLAEEYKQTNKMPERELIAGVNEYYDSLLKLPIQNQGIKPE